LLQLRAYRQLLAGRTADALGLVQRAVRMEEALPVEFGPPAITQPSHELLGQLLERSNPGGAMAAYRKALELAPRRALSLLGLARSAKAAGNQRIVREAVEELEAISGKADPTWSAMIRALRTSATARQGVSRALHPAIR
jgi:hypothetical protein